MASVSESLHPLTAAPRKPFPRWASAALISAVLIVLAILVWQGVTAQGVPDPTKKQTTPLSAFLDVAVLVFRDGL